MIQAYTRLHTAGDAHSVEVWQDTPQGERLVGGLYGVQSPRVFVGESMFHLEPHASKVALLAMIERLRAMGHTWMDIQMVTPHMEALGAREISRDEFLDRIG
jgi:leucyl/phenylalanyl-tRNA--protein transferase